MAIISARVGKSRGGVTFPGVDLDQWQWDYKKGGGVKQRSRPGLNHEVLQ